MDHQSIDNRYILIRIDEHGSKFLVARAVTLLEAKQIEKDLLAKQVKVHHQKYDILSYKLGDLYELLKRENILN